MDWKKNQTKDIIFNKISWFMVLNAFCKFVGIILVKSPELKPVRILSVKFEIRVSVEWFLPNLDWYLHRILSSVKYSKVWSCIIFSIIFETIGKREIGRYTLGFASETFLYRGLSFADLQLFGKRDSLNSDSHLPKKFVICLIENRLKMMKNAFYFILKVLFFLKIFKSLSWLFFFFFKTAWLER